MYRRRLLAVAGSSLVAPVSGCLDADDEHATGPTDDDGGVTDSTDGEENDRNGDDGSGETDESDRDDGSDGPDDASGETPIDTDWPWGAYADYETTDLRVQSADGKTLCAVRVALARTREQRYLGLSDAEEMPEDGGMLFVFDSASDRTFVMREMDFGIDIIYADESRTITEIHHAPEPGPDEDGNEQRYPGYGQYVLEVNYEWTARHGVSEGDVLDFELPTEN